MHVRSRSSRFEHPASAAGVSAANSKVDPASRRARAHGNEIVPPIKEKKEKDKEREGKTALCKTVSRTERAVFHAPVRSDERARERHVICMIPRCISDWLMNRSELASSRPLVRGNRGNATGPRDPPTPSNLIVRAVSPGRRGQEGAGGGAGARAVDGSLLCRARCRRHGSPETHTEREREREREGGPTAPRYKSRSGRWPRTKRNRDKKARNAVVPARRRVLDLAGGSGSASKNRGQRDSLN